jgi:hypothetical protein
MTYTGTLSGSGQVSLQFVAETPEYMLAHVIASGPLVRAPYDQSSDLVQRVGWVQFGDLVDLGFGTQAYWNDPIWINGLRWQWMLPAGQHFQTTRLRYLFSPGTSVFLYIAP